MKIRRRKAGPYKLRANNTPLPRGFASWRAIDGGSRPNEALFVHEMQVRNRSCCNRSKSARVFLSWRLVRCACILRRRESRNFSNAAGIRDAIGWSQCEISRWTRLPAQLEETCKTRNIFMYLYVLSDPQVELWEWNFKSDNFKRILWLILLTFDHERARGNARCFRMRETRKVEQGWKCAKLLRCLCHLLSSDIHRPCSAIGTEN